MTTPRPRRTGALPRRDDGARRLVRRVRPEDGQVVAEDVRRVHAALDLAQPLQGRGRERVRHPLGAQVGVEAEVRAVEQVGERVPPRVETGPARPIATTEKFADRCAYAVASAGTSDAAPPVERIWKKYVSPLATRPASRADASGVRCSSSPDRDTGSPCPPCGPGGGAETTASYGTICAVARASSGRSPRTAGAARGRCPVRRVDHRHRLRDDGPPGPRPPDDEEARRVPRRGLHRGAPALEEPGEVRRVVHHLREPHRGHLVRDELERRDDPDLRPGAAHGPEQVRVLVVARARPSRPRGRPRPRARGRSSGRAPGRGSRCRPPSRDRPPRHRRSRPT